jgi:hypothetical protein
MVLLPEIFWYREARFLALRSVPVGSPHRALMLGAP